jgi:formate--tetrahydrofolate ligase
MSSYGVPVVVALNRFPSDTDAEVDFIQDWCAERGIEFSVNSAALVGGSGAVHLATKVANILGTETAQNFKPVYSFDEPIFDKIDKVCKQIYRADGVEYSEEAIAQINKYTEMGYGNLPICISKTPNSFTDDAKILGAPNGFKIHIREVRLYAGAGLIVPLSGSLLLMPGLPKKPRCMDEFNG